MTTPAPSAARRQHRGKRGFAAGKHAENIAALLLFLKGYRILGTRLRTPYGEVDILAQKNSALVVVEVKTRGSMLLSHESISPEQQKRLSNAGQHLAARMGNKISSIRCDAFLFGKGGWPKHIRNAFE